MRCGWMNLSSVSQWKMGSEWISVLISGWVDVSLSWCGPQLSSGVKWISELIWVRWSQWVDNVECGYPVLVQWISALILMVPESSGWDHISESGWSFGPSDSECCWSHQLILNASVDWWIQLIFWWCVNFWMEWLIVELKLNVDQLIS